MVKKRHLETLTKHWEHLQGGVKPFREDMQALLSTLIGEPLQSSRSHRNQQGMLKKCKRSIVDTFYGIMDTSSCMMFLVHHVGLSLVLLIENRPRVYPACRSHFVSGAQRLEDIALARKRNMEETIPSRSNGLSKARQACACKACTVDAEGPSTSQRVTCPETCGGSTYKQAVPGQQLALEIDMEQPRIPKPTLKRPQNQALSKTFDVTLNSLQEQSPESTGQYFDHQREELSTSGDEGQNRAILGEDPSSSWDTLSSCSDLDTCSSLHEDTSDTLQAAPATMQVSYLTLETLKWSQIPLTLMARSVFHLSSKELVPRSRIQANNLHPNYAKNLPFCVNRWPYMYVSTEARDKKDEPYQYAFG